jgi:hypothetical protein
VRQKRCAAAAAPVAAARGGKTAAAAAAKSDLGDPRNANRDGIVTGMVLRRGGEGGARVGRRRRGGCAFCAVVTALSLATAKYNINIKSRR